MNKSPVTHIKLNQLQATAICGNDISSLCLLRVGAYNNLCRAVCMGIIAYRSAGIVLIQKNLWRSCWRFTVEWRRL
jgi:hypothetical protein